MKQILVRIAGVAMIIAGVAGLAFCIIGLVVLGRVQERVEPTLMEQVDLAYRALATTAEGLALVETSLADAVEMAESVEATMANVGQAAGDTVPTLDSIGRMVGEQLPETLEATQDTLASVAQSAQLIDDVLAVITGIPFLGLQSYNPETPLHQGLSDVSSSLDDIPTSLLSAQEGISVASGSLEELQGSFTAIAESIGSLTASLESAQSVVVQYRGVVSDLQGSVVSIRKGLPQWLRWIRLGLSLVLVWLGIAQIGLFTQGWELVARSRPTERSDSSSGAESERAGDSDGVQSEE